MNRLNWLFTLSSINVLLVTIERFSFTTKVLLQPYNFLRLHEVFQITVLILLTVLIPFFVWKEVSDNFKALQTKKGVLLGALFITGVYFYSTGNGVHELASHLFNTYCDTKHIVGNLCGGMFFNDYYFGNILYFVGGILMTGSLLFFERDQENKRWSKKEMAILVVNAFIFALAIFAYAAFDRVLVGLVYSVIMMLIADILFIKIRKKNIRYPFITYNALAYTLGTVGALIIKIVM